MSTVISISLVREYSTSACIANLLNKFGCKYFTDYLGERACLMINADYKHVFALMFPGWITRFRFACIVVQEKMPNIG